MLNNNAGISGDMLRPTLSTHVNLIKQVFETYLFGVTSVIQALVDLLRQSAEPRSVNVTTGLADAD